MTAFTERDQFWMRWAIALAENAAVEGEVPVGAVLVVDDQMVGEGSNRPIRHSDPTAHAEIIALREAATALQNYRLVNSTLYVTLEPCVMCVGAIVHARVKRLVFGALDPKGGAVQSAFQMADSSQLNHRVECVGGLFAEKCGSLLSEFFRARRGGGRKLSVK
ncbi:MAG: tRNA adenosine(34) deaminase TadA [Gammaproteobacteria bacterium]|nr:tRNA adenosine(34) deaminase TadA [Gammaproteobacteria bacterium]